jgi:hypothetical protein
VRKKLNKEMENLRNKNQKEILEIKKILKSNRKHGGKLFHQRRKISGLEDKIDIKQKYKHC